MHNEFIYEIKNSIEPEPNENVFDVIWKEYERVIVESLITSFGLDFLCKDQYGGDVDTIHNVRTIVDDNNNPVFKNAKNKTAYDNRGEYDSAKYHSDNRYREIKAEARAKFNDFREKIDDTYVPGKTLIPRNKKTTPIEEQAQLDHVISAKDIHENPGRVLAGLDGVDLANNPDNLKFTNAALNNNLRDKTVDEYILWCEEHPDQVNWGGGKGEPLPEEVKNRLREEYNQAQKKYNSQINKKYYTSSKFIKDVGSATVTRGAEMGLRQAVGLVFAELWFSCKENLLELPVNKTFRDIFEAVGEGIKQGIIRVKNDYKELIKRIEEGFASGAFSSVITSICNIFITTPENYVKMLRQVFPSIIQSSKVLLFNPDNLMFGDRLKKSTIIIGTGASVLVGTTVSDEIAKTPIGKNKVVGKSICSFIGTFISGIISCSMLLFMDRSKFINNLFDRMNRIPTAANNYKEIADQMEKLACDLENLDYDIFREEVEMYDSYTNKIIKSESQDELNEILLAAYKEFNIELPWNGDFNTFMGDKSNCLIFE